MTTEEQPKVGQHEAEALALELAKYGCISLYWHQWESLAYIALRFMARKPNKVRADVWVPENDSVETLELTFRASNAMKREGIKTIGDITALTDDELLRMPGVGLRTVAELRQCVANYLRPSAFVAAYDKQESE